MADLSHLEKMGRELKCPICLSLLNSAVSLACNHVFCNFCIVKSMKSSANCPVCKVPFRRREVRPAPHMDNLVTVFKSMEDAAGVNIFTTQVGPPQEKNPGEVEKIPGTSEAGKGRPKKKRPTHKSKNSEDNDAGPTDISQSSMPSFPAKKRIHVTPYPVSETPVRPDRVLKQNNNTSLNEDDRVAGGLDLTPFFWLREDNDDEEGGSSGKPSAQLTENMSQPDNVTCFTDIKDSEDDKSPVKMTLRSKSNVAEAFDSEMFEWTQSACSPELCATPLKKQAVGRIKLHNIQEKECQQQTGTSLHNEVLSEKFAKSSKAGQSSLSDQRKTTVVAKKGGITKRKRLTKSRGKHLRKCTSSSLGSSLNEVDTTEIVDDSIPEEVDDGWKLLGRGRSNNCSKKLAHGKKKNDVSVADAGGQVPTISVEEKIQNQEGEGTGTTLPVSPSTTISDNGGANVQCKSRKRRKQATSEPKKKCRKSTLDYHQGNVLDSVHTKIQEHQKGAASENGSPSSKNEIQKKQVEGSKGKRKGKIPPIDATTDGNAEEIHLASPETNTCNNNQSGTLAAKCLSSTKKFPDNGDKSLRKCDSIFSLIRCAFCQSSKDTKESGEMMHYFNGKPVAADYGGNVIHCHKHCTEWAPDVYFEDDLAVNLEAELARSRRIKCYCCGIKGAALGCCEKICRKSFHFTCAKLITECRWDYDNFVMLCPLHSSSKLPSEVSDPPKKRKKRSNPKESKDDSNTPTISKYNHDTNPMWSWPMGSACKWILCCSALNAVEKDIISEFMRLTGVSISKTWSPAVTHVIASTDEKGACKRTLKFLMGILEGKWILSIEWIKACMLTTKPVEEENFEITIDVHGISGGPRLGRLRAINKEPKLFGNIRFYLVGGFTASYKGYLQDLITAAGGTVLHRKPLTVNEEKMFHNSSSMPETFVVFSLQPPEKQKNTESVVSCRQAEAAALANACGAKVATNVWIIDSIAASNLQPLK